MYSDPVSARSVTVLLLVIALGHAIPAAAFFNSDLLAVFYGVGDIGPDLEVLLRHRALLFGIVAGILALGALRPAFRALALTVGWASIATFVYLAMTAGETNALIDRVAYADMGLAVLLAMATALSVVSKPRRITSPGSPAR
jgi:hypothetical protein